jgi:hypothetical protein
MMNELQPSSAGDQNPEAAFHKKLTAVFLVTCFFAVGVYFHLFHLNSHYYHTWIWRHLPGWPTYLMVGAASLPFFTGQIIEMRRVQATPLALAFVALSMFGLMLAGAAVQRNPPSLDRVAAVQMGWDVGYFKDAQRLQGMTVLQWLARYPRLLPHFDLHPRTKPPGLLLYETAMINLFGNGRRAAMVAGLTEGVLATFCVFATYAFIHFFTNNRRAAFCGASFFALCPGPVWFFPIFDQCYPIVTVTAAILWATALQKDRVRFSAGLGLVYGAATVVTYLPLVVGFFLVAYTWLKRREYSGCRPSRLIRHIAVCALCFVAFYAALWAVTAFNPIAIFRECLHQQDVLWFWLVRDFAAAPRHLPETIPADLYDFALGSAWISYLFAAFYFGSLFGPEALKPQAKFALLCVGQILMVAFTGLIQAETARVWIFMLPMLMVPVGLELEKWRPGARIAVYAMVLILTVVVGQSMTFLPSAQ